MDKIKLIELFGGIGSPRKALERLRIPFESIDYVEIDKYAVKSYNAMYGENYEPQDVSKVSYENVECDLLVHGSPCFVGNTYVRTEKGLKEIKDVIVGDRVKTIDSSFQKVLKIGSNGIKDIYSLKLVGQLELRLTNNHPFMVKKRTNVWNNSTRRYVATYSEPIKN